MMRLLNLLMALAAVLPLKAQTCHYAASDSLLVEQWLRAGQQQPLWFARQMMGLPYVAHTLECTSDEQLVVNLRELDCTTLVENVAALTLCARRGQQSFADFTRMLTQLRYRDGLRNGYTSRLHYFSDWIDNNAAAHWVAEVQQAEAPFTAVQTLCVNFMSTHPAAYQALREHPEYVDTIAQQEKRLTGRQYRYIPKHQVGNTALLRSLVSNGDIIAITTSKAGLDIAHLGLAVWRADGLHLLNASQIYKKVVEEPMTLRQYLMKHPSHTGIRVVRIL